MSTSFLVMVWVRDVINGSLFLSRFRTDFAPVKIELISFMQCIVTIFKRYCSEIWYKSY